MAEPTATAHGSTALRMQGATPPPQRARAHLVNLYLKWIKKGRDKRFRRQGPAAFVRARPRHGMWEEGEGFRRFIITVSIARREPQNSIHSTSNDKATG